MQLWHGSTDTTLAYPDVGEEIKQWANLYGSSQTPVFTDNPRSDVTRTRYGVTTTQAPVEAFSFAGYGRFPSLDGMFPHAITFLGLDGGSDPSPTPTVTPTPGTAGAVRGVGSGRCLDVSGVSQADGAQVQIWDRNGGGNQRWTRTRSGRSTPWTVSSHGRSEVGPREARADRLDTKGR